MGYPTLRATLLIFATGVLLLKPLPGFSQSATLINTTDTFDWSPPSPDPGGVVYTSHLGRLVVTDSEVNEISSLFTGSNLFETTLDGSLQRPFDFLDYTDEPTGIAYNPANRHLFISTDNSPKRVFEIDGGPDGIYGTADDVVSSFSTTAFGSYDAEGLSFDTSRGMLLLADGVNSEIYTVDPGFNGLFDGVPPEGDDVVVSFDTASIGVRDPEGVAFDSDFGHIYIVGLPRTRAIHVTTSGTLLRTLDVSSAGAQKLAGLAYAPSSVDPSGSFNLYVADRNVDNNSDPDENDGRLYELSLPSFQGNFLPAVTISAPSDETGFVVGDAVTFTGSASDPEDGNLSSNLQWNSNIDGVLGQSSSVTTSSLSEGTHVISATVSDSGGASTVATIIVYMTLTPNEPPVVTIDSPNSGSTYFTSEPVSFSGTASDVEDGDLGDSLLWESDLDGLLGSGPLQKLLSEGIHTITASATDSGDLTGTASVNVIVNAPDGIAETDSRIASASDDAEEEVSNGKVSLNSGDLEFGFDGTNEQIVGMRFTTVFVPQGANIVDAYVQFQADETNSGGTDLEILAEARDDAQPFARQTNNLSDRTTTTSQVTWSTPPWNSVGEAGAAQRTPNIASLIQEVVSRPGWASGNSIAILVRGTGERTAESYDGDAGAAPLLSLSYATEGSPPAGNTSPEVDAGPDQTLLEGETATLDGSVIDDGLPQPPGSVTVQWSQLDGAGTVTFADPASISTTATFSEIDTYRLGLTADDGELQGVDEMTITVNASAGNTSPVVTIDSPTSGSTYLTSETVTFSATATDAEDGDLDTGLLWESDLDGILGTGSLLITLSEGTHTITASATDSGDLTGTASVNVTVNAPDDDSTVTESRLASVDDDAEERNSNGNVSLTSTDLELGADGSNEQTVGMRFTNINVPQGAGIVEAYIQFQADESDVSATDLELLAEARDNAQPFARQANNLSDRPTTTSLVTWSTPPWNSVGEAGPAQRTPDIASLIQEVVSRPGWASGNSIAILVRGTGERTAESYDGDAGAAPLLHLAYTTSNTPPLVDAGIDQTLFPGESANLDGSVVDDGLPQPPGSIAVQWSQLDGPGTVDFSDPTSLTTTATFSEIGSHRLALTADDGELQGVDELIVTVNASAGNTQPVVDAGGDQTINSGDIANLNGSVVDEGVPDPAGVIVSWSTVSGRGDVTFGDPSAALTTASFPSGPGIYVLRLSADDGELQGEDELTITVLDVDGTATLDIRVDSSSDDAEEEQATGQVSLSSSDLEMVFDNGDQLVGTRFSGLNIPQGATITDAYIQFQVDEVSTDSTELVIQGESTDNANTFTSVNGNLSSRPRTVAQVDWNPAAWNSVREAGPDQRTPSLSPVIQELVNRSGWTSGNSIVILVSGTGKRVAESYDGSVTGSARLHLEFQATTP